MITKVETETFVYASYIRSTPEKIWQALTHGDFTQKYWFGFRVDVEPKLGGRVRFVAPQSAKESGHPEGKVLAFDPYKTLSYTWNMGCHTEKPDQNASPSRVTFELIPTGTMVKLRLIHENLSPEEVDKNPNSFKGINNGWPAVISSLKSLLETGEAINLS